jgi:ketosteroid isomerase-like protein
MPLSPDDLAEIRVAVRDLQDALNSSASNPSAWVYSYTEDAVFLGPGRPAIEGRDAFLAWAADVPPISSFEIEVLSIDGSGEMAAMVADASWEQGDTPVRLRSLLVWRRDADGRWRVLREMLNTDA